MSDPAAMATISALLRRGNVTAASVEGEALLRVHPDDPALLDLVGTVRCHAGDLAGGADLLRRSLEADPSQLQTRIRLANALAISGDAAGAEALCAGTAPELLRLRAYLLQSQGRSAEAIGCYEQIVTADPDDWEMWNNLGNARQAAGDLAGALDALGRARELRPDLAPIHLNYAMCLAATGRLEESVDPYAKAVLLDPRNASATLSLGKLLRELGRYTEALEPLRRAAALAPGEVEAQLELGRVHAGLSELDAAESAYRKALELSPDSTFAYLELGIILERGNRVDKLDPLLEEAEAQGVAPTMLAYLHALRLRDESRFDEALVMARQAPADIEPVRRAQLIGQLADRTGDPAAAFEAFAESNALAAKAADGTDARAFRENVSETIRLINPTWFQSWTAAPPEERPSPAFLVGFPRSGTTLLDTVLMGHRDVVVLEEEPILKHAEDALGSFDRLARLTGAEISHLRRIYFEELDKTYPKSAGKLVIDKFPLNMVRIPLIHRLFPNARIIFAQRHPCDVVLSCFMQTFAPNDAMANFLDLRDAATLYDLALTLWQRCCEVLPLASHAVAYENLIENVEQETRALLDFLGLPWDAGVLDHASTAKARGLIMTPSYSQVTRPLYREASGRWERYREQMAPVLPMLAPWAVRLGYGDPLAAGR